MNCIKFEKFDECVRTVEQFPDEVEVCCCSPEIPHDESLKIKLLYRNNDPSMGCTFVFVDSEDGEIRQINSNHFSRVNYLGIEVIGQQSLLYSLNQSFTKNKKRVVYLIAGKFGGKTLISKAFSNYVQERHRFKLFSYIDCNEIDETNVLRMRISGFQSLSEIDPKLKERDSLFILDNLDKVVTEQWKKFQDVISEYIEKTKACFIVTLSSDSALKKNMLHNFEVIQQIPLLNKYSSIALLKLHCNKYLNFSQKDLSAMLGIFTKKSYKPIEVFDLIKTIKIKQGLPNHLPGFSTETHNQDDTTQEFGGLEPIDKEVMLNHLM